MIGFHYSEDEETLRATKSTHRVLDVLTDNDLTAVMLRRAALMHVKVPDQMTTQKKMISYCPICGVGPFLEPVPEDELRASFWICECCGCEYGYTDYPSYREWWLKKMRKMGAKARWSDEKHQPSDWNLEEQLRYTDPTWNA